MRNVGVNLRVSFFRCGTTTLMSWISSSVESTTSDDAVDSGAGPEPLVPFVMVLSVRGASSSLRFLDAGSSGVDFRKSDT